MVNRLLLLVLLGLLAPPAQAEAPPAQAKALQWVAASEAAVAGVTATADRLALDQTHGWWALLYMRERVFGPPSSMVDDAAFFMASPEGWTPREELHATIAAFLTKPGPAGRPDEQPICVFPARFHWLTTQLPGFAAAAPQVPCPALESWRQRLRTDAVSFVFSSYFANNPSSLFGHSFLRLHKRPLPGREASEMLDESVNFSGYPTTRNLILYPLLGLAGRFPGRFTMMPLYMKIQEYNNSESRDLWTYELALSPDDIAGLQLAVWEMGPHTINYWYFDENCSLVLLNLLEAMRPSLVLAPLHPWVIPSDSLRVLERSPGLVKRLSFRPSSLARFLARYRALEPDERDLVDSIVAANDPSQGLLAIRLLPVSAQARLADAVVEFIDFDENLAGSKEAKIYRELRQALLVQRAALHQPKTPVAVPTPEAEEPHRIGGTTRVGGGVGYGSREHGLVEADWRPALHDLSEPTLGYGQGLAITFWDTAVRYSEEQKRVYLQRWDPLTIRSVPHIERVIRPFAWSFDVVTENLGACTRWVLNCYSGRIRGGIGPVASLGTATVYALLQAEGGWTGEVGAVAGPRLLAGGLLPWSAWTMTSFELSEVRTYSAGGTVHNEVRGQLTASFLLNEKNEFRLGFSRRPSGSDVLASLYYFY